MQPTLEEVKSLAREAGKIQRAGYEKPHDIKFKGESDVVTEVDFRCEALILEYIHNHFPGHNIIAEESGITAGDQDHTWYIDPLDGTINYSHGVPFFCVSIAYAEKGVMKLGVVYDPIRDECFSAERGKGAWLNDQPMHVSKRTRLNEILVVTGFANIAWRSLGEQVKSDNMVNFQRMMALTQGVRRMGSAALDLAYVAVGRMDTYWEMSVKAWDVAAGALLVEEAGGKVTTITGDAVYMVPPYALLAASEALHPQILELISKPEE